MGLLNVFNQNLLIVRKKNRRIRDGNLPKVLPWKAVLKDKIVKSGVPGS